MKIAPTILLFIVAIVFTFITVHHSQKAYNIELVLGETLTLLDKATEKGKEYQEHSEQLEKYLRDTIEQFETMKGVAERGFENTKEAQRQVKNLLEEIRIYQEHVNGYIAVITWYEEKCGNCPDPNLPD